MEELKEDYRLALEGRKYWSGLKKKYIIDDNDCLIICPTEDKLLNKTAMENLIDFLKRKYIEKTVVVSSYSDLEKYCPHVREKDIYFEYMRQREVESILKYYRLTQFARNIVVISLEQPYGNDNLVGKKGVTLADIVKNAVYV